jgi:alpha-beta hydrolase superfamily lysophospholipase
MVRDIGPVLAVQQSEVLETSFRPVNTDWRVTARYFRYGVPDESTAIVDQFKEWIASASMHSSDGAVVWSDRLGEVVGPTLLLAGTADRQRPAAAVAQTFAALGATDKALVRAQGFGHDDLLAGLRSPAEVYPLIAEWLAARS